MSHKTFLLPVLCVLFSVLPACSGVQLVTPAVSCERDGQSYPVGAGNIPAGDGCNTCFCNKDGGLVCTEIVCSENSTENGAGLAGLANPAAVKCEADGYKYEILTASDGSQSGICIDQNGVECPDWSYFRGECALGEKQENYSAALEDVSNSGADGSAILQIAADKSALTLLVHNLPDPEESSFYEAFLVKVEPLEIISLGKLAKDEVEQKYTLSYETPENLSSFNRVTVVLGSSDNKTNPPKNLLEGNFQITDNQLTN